MNEIACLVGDIDCFELGFLEREATPKPAMKFGIRLYLAELSLSDTTRILELVGVERCRLRSIIRYKKPIYSRLTVLHRITLRLMKP